MGTRGGRVRIDENSYDYKARDFITVKNIGDKFNLEVPKFVFDTMKSKINKYKIEDFDNHGSAINMKRTVEREFVKMERQRVDKVFKKRGWAY